MYWFVLTAVITAALAAFLSCPSVFHFHFYIQGRIYS